jgi:hypothetical protein
VDDAGWTGRDRRCKLTGDRGRETGELRWGNCDSRWSSWDWKIGGRGPIREYVASASSRLTRDTFASADHTDRSTEAFLLGTTALKTHILSEQRG